MRESFHRACRQFPAVLISGPRQSGKTTFLLQELAGSATYVTFDDPLERRFAIEDPNGFLDRFDERTLILDEIQYVPTLLPYLKIRIDRDRGRAGRFVLTGSQRFQLMAEVSESLAGRIALLELLPFTCLELTALASRPLADVVWSGSYPDPALDPSRRDLWASSYLQTYVERDVRQLSQIDNLRIFERLVELTAARHAQVLVKASLARDIGVSQPTVARWVDVLAASYIVYLLRPYFENLGKRVVKRPKLYYLDPALATHITRQPSPEAALAGAMGGAFFEGLVVSEAVRVMTARGRRPDLFYWRTQDGHEVDLIIAVGGVLVPVEIKLTATPRANHTRPLDRFIEIAGDRAAASGLLVCRVKEKTELPNRHMALSWHGFARWLDDQLTGEGAASQSA